MENSTNSHPASGTFLRLFLLYHEVRPEHGRYSYDIDAKTFEQHLDLYGRFRHSTAKSLYPEITFDDGHLSDLQIAAPLLQARGIVARFFITVGWTGTKTGYMGWPEVRQLHASGQLIGAHGWTHTLLTHLKSGELKKELEDSRKALEDNLGCMIDTMSLPGGRANRHVLNACGEAGYTHIFTSEPRAEAEPLGPLIGRVNILSKMDTDFLAALLDPRHPLLRRMQQRERLKAAAKTLFGDNIYEKVWALANGKNADPDASY